MARLLLIIPYMKQRCLIIADDLTGGADAGAQFAKRGISTLLISLLEDVKIDFSKHTFQDVLVINTNSRGLSPEEAFLKVSNLLKQFDQSLFPIIYKKIDSTLRGNIGYEIDAILKETDGSLCFMAPSYPEQNRRLVGGMLIVGKAAPALKEMRRGASPNIPESHVCKTLQQHSRNGVGWIDLSHVASGRDQLRNKVAEEREKGNQIIIFDAETRRDLKNIVEVAFRSERIPLFVGSAGLAEEVAKRLAPRTGRTVRRTKAFKHILIVSGTTSKVTHQQLDRLERQKATSFQLNPSLILGDTSDAEKGIRELSMKVGNSLPQGVTILRTPTDTLASQNSKERSIRLRILKTLASLALRALDESNIANHDLVLILTGGETAQNVIKGLEPQGIELEAELLNGIAKGRLIGGKWDGLTVVTKAGAFGQEDALETVVRMIKTGAP